MEAAARAANSLHWWFFCFSPVSYFCSLEPCVSAGNRHFFSKRMFLLEREKKRKPLGKKRIFFFFGGVFVQIWL